MSCRVLLNRMKDAVDFQLRDQHADFRRDRSCIDQTSTLSIILEESCDWIFPVYAIFIDYGKAFDSLDRHVFWELLRHYRVPETIIWIFRNSCGGMTCRVVCGRQLTDAFQVKTGARHHEWCRPTNSYRPSTGWRRHPQPREKMEFSGLLSHSLTAWALQMTWLPSPIHSDGCKKRLARLRII